MLDSYEKLLRLRCFSHEEAMQVLGEARKTTNILYVLKKKGLIQSVRRNLYVAISLETREPVASAFEIASAISKNTWISHHSALEFYGLANQVFSDVYVSSEQPFREFYFDGRLYHSIETPNTFGVDDRKSVRLTNLERTVLDSIKDFDKVGGLEELLRSLSMITVIREDILIEYLGRYHNRFLIQKAGYLLTNYPQMKLSAAFFDYCRKNIGSSSRYLYNDLKEEKCVFSKEWKLCVPESLAHLTEEGGNTLV